MGYQQREKQMCSKECCVVLRKQQEEVRGGRGGVVGLSESCDKLT